MTEAGQEGVPLTQTCSASKKWVSSDGEECLHLIATYHKLIIPIMSSVVGIVIYVADAWL